MIIPENHLPVMPYLVLKNARAFADFSKAVFGAPEPTIFPTGDGKIMHAELKIDKAVIMFADSGDNWKEKTAAMYLYVEDVNAVYNRALKNSAKSLEGPTKKDYGYTAGFEDPFGNQWFVVEAKSESS